MGFFSNILKSIKVRFGSYFGYQFTSHPFDRDAWEHDIFRATVDAIATHGAKGVFQAVMMKDGRVAKIIRNDPMTRLLNEKPNELMTGTEFKYRMIANLETRTTAIAYVKWNGSKPEAVYPLDFTRYEFKEITTGGLALEFTDFEGVTRALPLECVIIMRKFYNDRLASGDGNGPVYKVLSMCNTNDEGFMEFLNVSNKVRGILKQKKAMIDPEDIKKGQDSFAERMEQAAKKGGIISVDSMEEYTPINVDGKAANAAQSKAIENRIFTYLRTPECIVQNTYTEQQGMAWQQGKIEPIWDMFAEAVAAVYYTKHERECGNRMIMNSPVTMGRSVQSMVNILNATKETGELTTNERRELLGYSPVEDGDERQISLNFVKAGQQSEYQTGKKEEEESNGSNDGTGSTEEENGNAETENGNI